MSMTMRNQTINIDRVRLIKELEKGLATHQLEYQFAVVNYKDAVVKFMREACARAEAGDFTDLVLKFQKPQNHEVEIKNVIELMSYSVDENINLDAETFRAYVKGEWSWKTSFDMASRSLSGYLGHPA